MAKRGALVQTIVDENRPLELWMERWLACRDREWRKQQSRAQNQDRDLHEWKSTKRAREIDSFEPGPPVTSRGTGVIPILGIPLILMLGATAGYHYGCPALFPRPFPKRFLEALLWALKQAPPQNPVQCSLFPDPCVFLVPVRARAHGSPRRGQDVFLPSEWVL